MLIPKKDPAFVDPGLSAPPEPARPRPQVRPSSPPRGLTSMGVDRRGPLVGPERRRPTVRPGRVRCEHVPPIAHPSLRLRISARAGRSAADPVRAAPVIRATIPSSRFPSLLPSSRPLPPSPARGRVGVGARLVGDTIRPESLRARRFCKWLLEGARPKSPRGRHDSAPTRSSGRLGNDRVF